MRVFLIAAGAVCAAAALAACTVLAGHPAARADSRQLVYECHQQPCSASQELEVFDGYGDPIFSVGEYGGAGMFGDNFSVYRPGTVTHPALVFSYTTPQAYDRTHDLPAGCLPPSEWIAPQGTWDCRRGAWIRAGR